MREHVSTTEEPWYTKKDFMASLAYYDMLKPSCINAATAASGRDR